MVAPLTRHEVVSSDAKRLIRVNFADEPLGFLDKSACHDGKGVLYRAEFADERIEHELCWVYVGQTAHTPVINTSEIWAWRSIAPGDLDRELAEQPERFTPWLVIEWARLRAEGRIVGAA